MEKMTQRDYFNEIIKLATENNRDDIVKFAKARIDQLDKKSASRKPTKTQSENELIKVAIFKALNTSDKPMTCTEIKNSIGVDSLNKVVALVTQMVKAEMVVRTTEGKKAVFSVAKTEETAEEEPTE